MKKYYPLFTVTLFGFIVRFVGLGDRALWCDEALFGFFLESLPTQEFTTVLIAQFFGFHSEFELRIISCIAGTLTIPAIYFVLKDKKTAIYASIFVAVCPLFVFWSRLARPYSFSGLFVVLGWRWAWCYIVAIATTPISLIGVRIFNQSKYVLLTAIVIAVTLFFLREDSNRNWTIQNALNSSRFFYIPLMVLVLYFFDYVLKGRKV